MSTALKDIPIQLSDFKPSTTSVIFNNLTTKTVVKDGTISIAGRRNSDPNTDASVFISEVREKSLVLEIPTSVGNTGHQILVEITHTSPEQKKLTFSSSSKLISLENLGDGRASAELQLIQFDEKSWIELQRLFSKNQEDALELFHRIRGY